MRQTTTANNFQSCTDAANTGSFMVKSSLIFKAARMRQTIMSTRVLLRITFKAALMRQTIIILNFKTNFSFQSRTYAANNSKRSQLKPTQLQSRTDAVNWRDAVKWLHCQLQSRTDAKFHTLMYHQQQIFSISSFKLVFIYFLNLLAFKVNLAYYKFIR